MAQQIRVFAPATIGNVSCGFDVLGLAINQPGDFVTATQYREGKVVISDIQGDKGKLPLDATKNTAGIAVKSLLKALDSTQGFDLKIEKKMPIGSGLGSSAASAVAAVVAVNELLGRPFSRKELIPFALEAEMCVAGKSADNIAPCLLGGLVLIRSYEPLDVVRINPPSDLYCALVYPHVEVLTKQARSILPTSVPLPDAIKQWGNVAGLVTGFLTSDYALLGRSMTDYIIEPHRAKQIPHFYKVQQTAIKYGALGCGISGSGPSIFALCKGEKSASKVGELMKKVLENQALENTLFVSKINSIGAQIVE